MEKKAFVISAICGVVSAVCLLCYVSMIERQANAERQEVINEYGGERVDALVATKDIYPGETLDATNTQSKVWAGSMLPEGAITDSRDAWGKKVSSSVLSGEVVSKKRMEGTSEDVQIPDGLVAVSVPAKDVQAVGGSLSPGDRVDVYAVGTKTTLIGKGVLVLETSSLSSEDSARTKIEWVTLAVDPEKAQEFITASESLEVYFALPAQSQEATDDGSGVKEESKKEE